MGEMQSRVIAFGLETELDVLTGPREVAALLELPNGNAEPGFAMCTASGSRSQF